MRRLFLFLALAGSVAYGQTYGRMEFSLTTPQGQAIAGAKINVYTQSGCGVATSGTLATLYPASSGGIALSQPLTTNGTGTQFAYATPGCYTVTYTSNYTGTVTYPDQAVNAGTFCSVGSSCTVGSITASNEVTGGVVGGVPNVSQQAGADIGARAAAAYSSIPLTNGLQHGTVSLAPTANGLKPVYTVLTTIEVPKGSLFDCKGAYLYWPYSDGILFHTGSVPPGTTGTSATTETKIKDCQVVGPAYTPETGGTYSSTNASVAIAPGGDPGSNFYVYVYVNGVPTKQLCNTTTCPSTLSGAHLILENVNVAGFGKALWPGNGYADAQWNNSQIFRNNVGIYDSLSGTTPGVENPSLNGDQFWGNFGPDIVITNGNHWAAKHTRFDYCNAAGLNQPIAGFSTSLSNATVRAANSCILLVNGTLDSTGGWYESDSGPKVTFNPNANTLQSFTSRGDTFVLSAPIGSATATGTAPLTACKGDGTVATFTGTFPSSMTNLLSTTGLMLQISPTGSGGFTGACSAFNGLNLNSCQVGANAACVGVTSTTFTALSPVVVAQTSDTGTATVPAESGLVFFANTGGSSQATIDAPFVIANTGGAANNALNAVFDKSGNGGAVGSYQNIQGTGGTAMPPLGSSLEVGAAGAVHTTFMPYSFDNTFNTGSSANQANIFYVAPSGPQQGKAWSIRVPNTPSSATSQGLMQGRLNVITLPLTAATVSGSACIYTGTITYPAYVSSYQHSYLSVTGFGPTPPPVDPNNGGPFLITASNSTTITANNTLCQAEIGATATGYIWIPEQDFGPGGVTPSHYIQWQGAEFITNDPFSSLGGFRTSAQLFSSLPSACIGLPWDVWISDSTATAAGAIVSSGTGTPSSATTVEIKCYPDNNWRVVPNGINSSRTASGYSNGVATSSTTVLVGNLGGSVGNFASVFNAAVPVGGFMVDRVTTISNLNIWCNAHGVGTNEVFTLYKRSSSGGAATATSLTVRYDSTVTAGSLQADTTDTYTTAAFDTLYLAVPTSATETLANCTASFTMTP